VTDCAAGLVSETMGGETYWLAASAQRATRTSRRAYLLPPFDEFIVGYKDRGAVLDPAFTKKAISGGMFRPAIVIHGRVAGTWKREVKKGTVVVTVSAFGELAAREREAVAMAAERYGRFLGMPVVVEC